MTSFSPRAGVADQLWARMLGLGEGDVAGLEDAWRSRLASTEATAAIPGWRLAEDEEEPWFSAVFRFPAFEAAALFTNFLLATLQMTTAAVAVQVLTGSDGEVAVKIRDSAAEGLTFGVVLFARFANEGARHANGHPQGEGTSDGAG